VVLDIVSPAGADHDHRAVRVVDDLGADRAEQQPREAAPPPRAHDDQIRVPAGLDESTGWRRLPDGEHIGDARLCSEHLACKGVESALGFLHDCVAQRAGVCAVAGVATWERPGADDVELGLPQFGLLGGETECGATAR
jgi:hypothetical protein